MQVKPIVLQSFVCVGLVFAATTAWALNSAGEGRRTFLSENCYGCHGGRGGGGMGPNFRDDRPDAHDVSDAVSQGKPGGMPPFPNLTSRDVNNLAAYFKSLRSNEEPTFTHWWEAVPTQ
jgi:cytochrome c551